MGTGEAEWFSEEVYWFGSRSYETYEEAMSDLRFYLASGFYGWVVQAKSESHRISLEAERAEFVLREPDILQRKEQNLERRERRYDRMFLAPWYSQPFWRLVYGNPRAWAIFGAITTVVTAGCIIAFLLR